MKKILLIVLVVLLAACSPAPAAEVPPAADTTSGDLSGQLSEKDAEIAVLEYQLADLGDQLDTLQLEYDALLAASEGLAAEEEASSFMCQELLGNVRYDTPVGTIAILEGWFATQDFVQSMDGTYSTQFWTGVNSRIHTIRYTAAEDGLSTTANFLIMFEEAGWQPGILYLDNSCWLDYPY
jgi:hypothetical protein